MDLKFNIYDEVSYRQRLAFNWVREGKTRSISWLFSKIKSGKFLKGVNNEEEAKTYCDVIDKYYSILNKVYGENWDAHLAHLDDRYTLNIVIMYPKVKITNSENLSHTIRDLIVSFPIEMKYSNNITSVKIGILSGTRATLSLAEFNSYYSHSHLSSNARPSNASQVFNSREFCLGNGEITETRMMLNTTCDPNLFEMFLYNIDTLVHWESIEGAPYKYVKNISIYGDSLSTETISNSLLKTVASLTFSSIERKELKPNFIIQGNRYKLKIDETLHDFIKDLLVSLDSTSGTLYKISPESGYILYFSSNYSKHPGIFKIYGMYEPFTIIRSKEIPFKILPHREKDEEFNINEFKVSPKILKYVTEQVNARLYKSTVRENAIRHYNKTISI